MTLIQKCFLIMFVFLNQSSCLKILSESNFNGIQSNNTSCSRKSEKTRKSKNLKTLEAFIMLQVHFLMKALRINSLLQNLSSRLKTWAVWVKILLELKTMLCWKIITKNHENLESKQLLKNSFQELFTNLQINQDLTLQSKTSLTIQSQIQAFNKWSV